MHHGQCENDEFELFTMQQIVLFCFVFFSYFSLSVFTRFRSSCDVIFLPGAVKIET